MHKTKRIKLKTRIRKPNIKRLIKSLRKETRCTIKDTQGKLLNLTLTEPNVFDWYLGHGFLSIGEIEKIISEKVQIEPILVDYISLTK